MKTHKGLLLILLVLVLIRIYMLIDQNGFHDNKKSVLNIPLIENSSDRKGVDYSSSYQHEAASLYEKAGYEFLRRYSIGNPPTEVYDYTAKDSNLYVNGVLLDGSDANTVSTPHWPYLEDINNVYYKDWIVEEADPATFTVAPNTNPFYGGGYYISGDNVYFNGKIVDGATASTIKNILVNNNQSSYAIDSTSIYKDGIKLGNLGSEYTFIDDTIIQNGNKILETGIEFQDLATVQYLGLGYFVDKYNAYGSIDGISGVKSGILDGVDATGFKVFTGPENYESSNFYDSHYTIENGKVYFTDTSWGYKVPLNLNAESFEVIDWPYVTDGSNYYYRDNPIESNKIDRETFSVKKIGDYLLGMDASNVFHESLLLEGISPFEIKYLKGTQNNTSAGYIYYDADTAWYIRRNCEGYSFVPEKFFLDQGYTRERYLSEYHGC